MTITRFEKILDDCMKNKSKPFKHEPSPRMRDLITKGRYEIIDSIDHACFMVDIEEATLIATYTSRTTRDINIYKTCRRKSKPFILIPCHESTAYSWRVPITIL